MKLGSKLLLSYSAISLLVFIVGLGSYLLNQHVKEDLLLQNERGIMELQSVSNLETQLLNSLIFTRNTLVEKKRRDQLSPDQFHLLHRNSEEDVRRSLQGLSEQLTTLRQPPTPEAIVDEELAVLEDSLQNSFQIYSSLLRELLDVDREELDLADEMLDLTIEPYFRSTMLPLLDRYRTIRERRIDQNLVHFEDRVGSNARWILGLTGLALFVSVMLSFWMVRHMTHPLQRLTRAADRIGTGKLDDRIEIRTGDELEQLGDSFNRMVENLNRTMVTKQYVDNIIQSMGDMLMVTTHDGHMELVNQRLTENLGYRSEDLENRSLDILFAPDELDRVRPFLETNGRGTLETALIRKDGKSVSVNLNKAELPGSTQVEPKRVLVCSDITTLKAAEQRAQQSLKEKEVMLAEIHHRVKNNLAVITGLLELQVRSLSREEGDPGTDALKESQLRIQSIALVHELLYQSETFSRLNLPEYIEKLALAIRSAHRHTSRDIELDLDLDDLEMTINQAIPLSLILNELVVNAYKHAFGRTTRGRISIRLKRKSREVELIVEDDGSGLPDSFDPMTNQSLGMTLIRTLVSQLHAELTVGPTGSESGGARFGICFTPEPTT